MDGLRKRTVACSGAGDEAAACSGTRIMDGKWRRWRDDF
jgi:hypothetical protein